MAPNTIVWEPFSSGWNLALQRQVLAHRRGRTSRLERERLLGLGRNLRVLHEEFAMELHVSAVLSSRRNSASAVGPLGLHGFG